MPNIISATDYAPFGMHLVGRKWNAGNYRYGFNGKENDNEVKGEGNQQDYGMRFYDPRIGRFLSLDPLTIQFPELTPYQFASNIPIKAIDIDGLETSWRPPGQAPAPDSYRFGAQSTGQGNDALALRVQMIKRRNEPIVADVFTYHTDYRTLEEEKRDNKQAKERLARGNFNDPYLHIIKRENEELVESSPVAAVPIVGNAIKAARHARLGNSDAAVKASKELGKEVVITAATGVVAGAAGSVYRTLSRGRTYYRAMSNAEYAALQSNNGLTHMPGKELFVSSRASYSRAYLQKDGYDVLVEFTMKPGTIKYFDEIGVMHRTAAGSTGWAGRGSLLWKSEKNVMNLGIQSNTHLFNPWIQSFKIIK